MVHWVERPSVACRAAAGARAYTAAAGCARTYSAVAMWIAWTDEHVHVLARSRSYEHVHVPAAAALAADLGMHVQPFQESSATLGATQ